MKIACIILLFSFTLGGLTFSNSARAQESDEQTAKPVQPQADPDKAPPPQTSTNQQKKSNSDKDSEVFKPSEEISEDFAVSFPVDI
jgi:hypothetical protein